MKSLTFNLCIFSSLIGFLPAASINISFAGDRTGNLGVQIFADDVAGVVPGSSWNRATGKSGEMELITTDGQFGGNLLWDASNTWGGNGADNADERLMNGWLDDTGFGAGLFISGIPFVRYDIYIYGGADGGNGLKGYTMSVNGTEYFSKGAFVNLSDDSTFFDGSNYVNGLEDLPNPSYFKYPDVTGDLMSLGGARNTNGPLLPTGSRDYRGTVAGIQIVEIVPEVSTNGLLMCSLLGFAAVRRRA